MTPIDGEVSPTVEAGAEGVGDTTAGSGSSLDASRTSIGSDGRPARQRSTIGSGSTVQTVVGGPDTVWLFT